jgi:hypothetical protein
MHHGAILGVSCASSKSTIIAWRAPTAPRKPWFRAHPSAARAVETPGVRLTPMKPWTIYPEPSPARHSTAITAFVHLDTPKLRRSAGSRGFLLSGGTRNAVRCCRRIRWKTAHASVSIDRSYRPSKR